MTKLHEALLKECELKLKVSQFQVVEAVTNMNTNIEFFGGQMISLNATVALQRQDIKRLEEKVKLLSRSVH